MSDNKQRISKAAPAHIDLFGEQAEFIPILRDRYSTPPFNVFDTRIDHWNKRRKKWREFLMIGDVGIQGEEIEDSEAFDKYKAGQGIAKVKIAEEAVFDPFLLEVLFDFYAPHGGRIIDPFNGSHISGSVATVLGYNFTGIDVRPIIIEQNYEKIKQIIERTPGTLLDNSIPEYLVGNSNNVLDDLIFEQYDLFNSCPPYANLVKYSAKNPIEGDISLLDYDEFVEVYRSIIAKCCFLLRDNCYATITIGQVRDKKLGNLLPFMEDTITAFKDCGMKHWNEVPLIGAFGSAAMRAKGTFERGKGKLVNVHQTVLIFKKC